MMYSKINYSSSFLLLFLFKYFNKGCPLIFFKSISCYKDIEKLKYEA